METVLITGVAGMVGSHMIEFYSKKDNINVIGSYYNSTIDISEIENLAILEEGDLRYYNVVFDLINRYRPDKIFHLAAQSYPSISWDRAQETLDININSTLHVFNSIIDIKKNCPSYDPTVVIACSSAQYGQTMLEVNGTVTEKDLMQPLSPYGVSKVAQDLLSFQYFKSHGIRTIRARIFNTTGPRKSGDVLSDFIKRAIKKENDPNYQFFVGNLDSMRSINDVRDLVSALHLLSIKGVSGEAYNICSKNIYKIGELLSIIEKLVGVPLNPKLDKSLLRLTDEKIITGSSTKLESQVGWEPLFSIEQTIQDMIDYERIRTRRIS